jgi:hypothetical protein
VLVGTETLLVIHVPNDIYHTPMNLALHTHQLSAIDRIQSFVVLEIKPDE